MTWAPFTKQWTHVPCTLGPGGWTTSLGSEKGKVSLLSFANIFSCSVTSYSLNTVFHRAEFFFILKNFQFFFSCIVPLMLYLKSHHQTLRSSKFPPMLSSRSFIVLYFTFRSLIHFVLIFAEGVRSLSRFSFLHVDVQLFQHHLL